jgi:hypothetical protein
MLGTMGQTAAEQMSSALNPFVGLLQQKVVDIASPAAQQLATQLRPQVEDILKKTVLPEVITWGGVFLLLSIAIGAIVGSAMCKRTTLTSVFTRPRRRRHVA